VVLVAGVRGARVCPRLLVERTRDEQPQQERHEHDENEPAEELCGGELPDEEDPEHEPELPDEIPRGELERERGCRRRSVLKERLRDRDGRVRARGRRGAECGRARDGRYTTARERALDPGARYPRLDDRGDRETETERLPHLVRHLGGIPQSVEDDHRRVRR